MVGFWAKAEEMERLAEGMREMERTRGAKNQMKTVNAIIFYFFRQACMRFS